MSGIGANLGNSEILNIERVKKDNIPQTVDNMKKSAEVDGNNNVILVKHDGNDAIVANVKLDSSLNLSSVALEKEGKLGNFIGEIKFFDNGSDDKQLLERKASEAMQPKPASVDVQPYPVLVTGETKPLPVQPKNPDGSPVPYTLVEEVKPADEAVEAQKSEKSMYNLSMDQSHKFISVLYSLGWHSTPEEIKKDLSGYQKDLTTREKTQNIKSFQGGEKPDGKWGMSTFLTAKNEYERLFECPTPTDKEFRKVIDDFIKFYDGGITLKALVEKHKLPTGKVQ